MIWFFVSTMLMAMCVAAVFLSRRSGRKASSPVAQAVAGSSSIMPHDPRLEPRSPRPPKANRWEVFFAGCWMECVLSKAHTGSPSLQLCVVRLTDRRTHSREIIRRLEEVRIV